VAYKENGAEDHCHYVMNIVFQDRKFDQFLFSARASVKMFFPCIKCFSLG